jgi:hypothetical protein
MQQSVVEFVESIEGGDPRVYMFVTVSSFHHRECCGSCACVSTLVPKP